MLKKFHDEKSNRHWERAMEAGYGATFRWLKNPAMIANTVFRFEHRPADMDLLAYSLNNWEVKTAHGDRPKGMQYPLQCQRKVVTH